METARTLVQASEPHRQVRHPSPRAAQRHFPRTQRGLEVQSHRNPHRAVQSKTTQIISQHHGEDEDDDDEDYGDSEERTLRDLEQHLLTETVRTVVVLRFFLFPAHSIPIVLEPRRAVCTLLVRRLAQVVVTAVACASLDVRVG